MIYRATVIPEDRNLTTINRGTVNQANHPRGKLI